jgi:dihydroflavonol-4-reductase
MIATMGEMSQQQATSLHDGPILVTGATGLLGNNVVRLLLERGQRVRVLIRKQSDPRPLEGLAVEVAHGDIRDKEAVRSAVTGAKAIVHAAGWLGLTWQRLELARAINVGGACHVADAALESGARMIHVSTVDAMAPGSENQPADEETPGSKPPCSYVVSKREAEQEIQCRVSRGLDAVIVNPGFLIGPWDWKPSSGQMVLEIARRFAPVAPRGGLSICDPRDVAAGILAAIERGRPGRRYLMTGENMTYFEAWRRFAALNGRRGPLKRMSRPAAWLGGAVGDLWERFSQRETMVNSAAIRISNLFHYYSCQRAIDELGYQFRPADESIRDAWNWFVAHGYVGSLGARRHSG